jgi:hypothetical protein
VGPSLTPWDVSWDACVAANGGEALRQEHEAAVKIGKAIREKKTHLLRQLVRYLGKPACLEVLEETLRIEVRHATPSRWLGFVDCGPGTADKGLSPRWRQRSHGT